MQVLFNASLVAEDSNTRACNGLKIEVEKRLGHYFGLLFFDPQEVSDDAFVFEFMTTRPENDLYY